NGESFTSYPDYTSSLLILQSPKWQEFFSIEWVSKNSFSFANRYTHIPKQLNLFYEQRITELSGKFEVAIV
ncbi:hypothetical protein RRG08_008052, partial [Elysia crispata]